MAEVKKSWRDVLGRVVFWLVVAFVVFAGVMTLVLDFMRRDEPKMDISNVVSAAPVPKPDVFSHAVAVVACKNFIKKILHDPDSAKFSDGAESEVVAVANRAFVVQGVRAKNAFGAMRLKDFACFMEIRSGDIYSVLITEKGERVSEATALLKEWNFIEK